MLFQYARTPINITSACLQARRDNSAKVPPMPSGALQTVPLPLPLPLFATPMTTVMLISHRITRSLARSDRAHHRSSLRLRLFARETARTKKTFLTAQGRRRQVAA